MTTKQLEKLAFQPFKDNRLADTCSAWSADVSEGDAFPADVEQILDWAQRHQSDAANGDSTAYGVFEAGTTIAAGICEVVLTRPTARGAWVKLLRLRLRPSLESKLFANDVEAHGKAIDIFVAAIRGVIDLKARHKATTLKVFGRTNEQLTFLQALASALQAKVKLHSVSIKGRWLVIESK